MNCLSGILYNTFYNIFLNKRIIDFFLFFIIIAIENQSQLRRIKMNEIFNNYLKKDGLKITSQRISILKNIKLFKRHFNADDIYELLKKRSEKTSRASVYRMIPFLKKDGIIKEVGRDNNNKIIYEYVKDVPHHDHLICVKCGKIIEFKNDDIELSLIHI